MARLIKRGWPLLAILLVLALSAVFLLWPAAAQPLSVIVIVLGIGVAAFVSIRRNVLSARAGAVSRRAAAGNIALEIGALLLITFLAIALTRAVAMQIVPPVASAAEAAQPGLGLPAGFGAGLLLALGIGVCVSLIIRFLIQKIRAVVARTS